MKHACQNRLSGQSFEYSRYSEVLKKQKDSIDNWTKRTFCTSYTSTANPRCTKALFTSTNGYSSLGTDESAF